MGTLSQTLRMPGVGLAQGFTSSGWESGGRKTSHCSDTASVFVVKADKHSAGLFCFVDLFTSTSDSDVLAPQMGKPSSAWLGGLGQFLYFLPSAFQPQAATKQLKGWILLPTRKLKIPWKSPCEVENIILEVLV